MKDNAVLYLPSKKDQEAKAPHASTAEEDQDLVCPVVRTGNSDEKYTLITAWKMIID